MSSAVNEVPQHDFELQSSLFAKPQKLIITPEVIQYNGITIHHNTFNDVKYSAESIVWYKFYVGVKYSIDIKFEETKVLPIVFSSYHWKNKQYGRFYTEISRYIGKYFLGNIIDAAVHLFHETGILEVTGLNISHDKIEFEFPQHTIAWQNVGLKEYPTYFAIYDKSNPKIHKRATFDEWNAEILFHTLKSLIEHFQTVDQG